MQHHISLPAEWETQDAVLLAWPHAATDWRDMLDEARACYVEIAKAILKYEPLVIVSPDGLPARDIEQLSAASHRILNCLISTNDTWARDFGPITIFRGGIPTPLDFRFNAWGLKYAADKDNLVNLRLDGQRLFKQPLASRQGFVLEGGSIESDGRGTVMTTSRCLLAPNRNDHMSKEDIEEYLKLSLGAKKILWLNHGEVEGDDTDGHIDTLARFAPGRTIVYNGGDEKMLEELKAFTNAEGEPFNLMELPLPDAIVDAAGKKLPATYANFLVINGAVLVPVYGQPEHDQEALKVMADAFPGRAIMGIDCRPLIRQHGSLHCVTMQFPKNSLNL